MPNVTREELAEALRMSTELMAHAGGYAGTVAMNRSILSRLDAEAASHTIPSPSPRDEPNGDGQ